MLRQMIFIRSCFYWPSNDWNRDYSGWAFFQVVRPLQRTNAIDYKHAVPILPMSKSLIYNYFVRLL